MPSNSETIGIGICGCYADSTKNSLDECQGDTSGCAIAGCFRNTCDGFSAYCSEEGMCLLRESNRDESQVGIDSAETTTTSTTSTSSTTEEAGLETDVPAWCTNDEDCSDNRICNDQSNGRCFSPPCGRCIESNENNPEIGIDSADTTPTTTSSSTAATTSSITEKASFETDASTWCTSDEDCTDNLICNDESNGNCFFPPCGRCIDLSEDINVMNQGAMSMPLEESTLDDNPFAFLNEPE